MDHVLMAKGLWRKENGKDQDRSKRITNRQGRGEKSCNSCEIALGRRTNAKRFDMKEDSVLS